MRQKNSTNPESSVSEDAETIQEILQGNKLAYGKIVKKYMKRAYFAAIGLVGNQDDALDLSQDAFVRAYRALVHFDTKKQFFTWYYAILRNLCFNHLRKNLKFSPAMSNETVENIADTAADPSIIAERNDLTERLWNVIASLKVEEREIIALREFEGYTYEEIAELLSIPIGTVMSRLFNARKHLREKLEDIL